ncbi:MAG: TrgA family protein [Paracoccaceae bacterium]
MPTAAKLVAAAVFAALSWVVAGLYIPGLPEGTLTGLLRPVAAGMGVIWGWRVAGRLAGRGYAEGAANGLRTAVTIAFWVLLVFSIHDMVLLSMKMRYHGPMDALLGVFAIMLDYARYLATVPVIAGGLIGGMIGGIITEWASRRWT